MGDSLLNLLSNILITYLSSVILLQILITIFLQNTKSINVLENMLIDLKAINILCGILFMISTIMVIYV